MLSEKHDVERRDLEELWADSEMKHLAALNWLPLLWLRQQIEGPTRTAIMRRTMLRETKKKGIMMIRWWRSTPATSNMPPSLAFDPRSGLSNPSVRRIRLLPVVLAGKQTLGYCRAPSVTALV